MLESKCKQSLHPILFNPVMNNLYTIELSLIDHFFRFWFSFKIWISCGIRYCYIRR